jgi:hypothetical protein
VTLERNRGADEAGVAREILEWTTTRFTRTVWGRGHTYGSCKPALDHAGVAYSPIVIWTTGGINVLFQGLQTKPPFNWPDKRFELLRRLNAIPGVNLPEDSIAREPSFQLNHGVVRRGDSRIGKPVEMTLAQRDRADAGSIER